MDTTSGHNVRVTSRAPTIILASASPRRQELLRRLGIPFRAVPAGIDEAAIETAMAGSDGREIAMAVATAKAVQAGSSHGHGLVVAADTVVSVDGHGLGKPIDADDAVAMLRRLSGRTHEVTTAVVLSGREQRLSCAVSSLVSMRVIGEDEIRRYVESGEPMDKAGAYAVQGNGARFIGSVDGCYNAVVGLPVCATVFMLGRLEGVDEPDPVGRCVRTGHELMGGAATHNVAPHPSLSALLGDLRVAQEKGDQVTHGLDHGQPV